MNEKEIAEIRRRFKPDTSNIGSIRGCYVNEKQEIIAEFNQAIANLPEDETEKFLAILKRTLSGTLEKNLLNIEFSTGQVVQSEEHGLLMRLRDSALKDEDAVQNFFQRVIQTVALEENYLILLAQEVYDIPYRSRHGEMQEDAATDVFTYLVCSICPVKMTKPALSYDVRENEFHSRNIDRIVSPPEMGFLFPAFDDRSANLYGALYYTRDIADNHEDFVNTVFNCEIPQPAALQKETFQEVLSTALDKECSIDKVQAVHGQLQAMVEEHKADKVEEPLKISKGTVKQLLQKSGASETCVANFEEQYDTAFGADTSLSPRNIIDLKQTIVTAPNVTVRVSGGCSNLVETRIIDGVKYILIRAEDGVELNGVPIQIT